MEYKSWLQVQWKQRKKQKWKLWKWLWFLIYSERLAQTFPPFEVWMESVCIPSTCFNLPSCCWPSKYTFLFPILTHMGCERLLLITIVILTHFASCLHFSRRNKTAAFNNNQNFLVVHVDELILQGPDGRIHNVDQRVFKLFKSWVEIDFEWEPKWLLNNISFYSRLSWTC